MHIQTFRDLERREQSMTLEFKGLNKELSEISRTFNDAENAESEAAEHVVNQSTYMKQQAKFVKKIIGKASANYTRCRAQSVAVKQKIEETKQALVNLDTQLVAATVAPTARPKKGKKLSGAFFI